MLFRKFKLGESYTYSSLATYKYRGGGGNRNLVERKIIPNSYPSDVIRYKKNSVLHFPPLFPVIKRTVTKAFFYIFIFWVFFYFRCREKSTENDRSPVSSSQVKYFPFFPPRKKKKNVNVNNPQKNIFFLCMHYFI